MNKLIEFVLLLLLTFIVGACSDNETETPKEVFYPGQIISEESISAQGEMSFFKEIEIPDTIFALMQGKSFKEDCTVPRSDLRYLLCLHRDINGRAIVGEMVVNKKISSTVLNILLQLYKANYPIERMRLVDYWNADDEMTMRDNNSSSFNFRFISHTTTVSKHGKGVAIDINTLYNPYHKILEDGTEIIEPATGAPYLDRSKSFPYKIEKGDLCYKLFTENGFEWGGDWTTRKDYQHFELIEE